MVLISIPDGRDKSTDSKADLTAKAPATEKKVAVAGSTMYSVPSVYGKIDPIKGDSGMYSIAPLVDTNLNLFAAPAVKVNKATKPAKEKKQKVEPAPASAATPLSKLDLVVGKIVAIKKHPEADSLYIEQIDCGESTGPREIVSGLVKFIPESDMLVCWMLIQNKHVVVLRNLKPANMRGVKSFGMVLCASNADHTAVELLIPPEGSVAGDVVYFEGHQGTPEPVLNPKKKIFESVQIDFKTGDDLVARWKDVAFQTLKGVVRAKSLKAASIK